MLLTEVDLHDTYPLARLGEQETVVTQGVPTHSDSSCLIMPGEWMGDPWLRLQKHVVANAHRRASAPRRCLLAPDQRFPLCGRHEDARVSPEVVARLRPVASPRPPRPLPHAPLHSPFPEQIFDIVAADLWLYHRALKRRFGVFFKEEEPGDPHGCVP